MSPLLPRSARQSSRRVLAALAMGLAQEVTWLNKSLYTPAIKNTALQSGYLARAFTTEYN